VKRLVAAVMFLTRLRVPGNWDIGSSDVGRAAAFYPLVGAGIGGILYGFLAVALYTANWVAQHARHPYTAPAPVLAVLVVVLSVAITGGLHLDGLADTVDGFGGGRSRDDVLRIMHDSAIGTFGAVAIALLLALKIACVLRFIQQGSGFGFLVVAPSVARASAALFGFALPYARMGEHGVGAAIQHVKVFDVIFGSLTAVAFAIGLAGWRGGVCLAAVSIASLWQARLCMKRIQGITGDTIGANLELSEALALTVGAILTP
jgi:adenosylcobinamide-GDP ribazoletransferase